MPDRKKTDPFLMTRYIVAIDSFKGCLTSAEAGQTVADALRRLRPEAEVVCMEVSDGGEGMVDAFTAAMHGEMVEVQVHDAMMRPVTARYGLCPGGVAVIETAQACGLTLIAPEDRNPLVATTYGVGEMLADAVRRGCQQFIVGLGGSATSDAGIGMLRAMVDALAPRDTFDKVRAMLSGCRFTLASDVRNPLCGPDGAAHTFAPQKGANPDQIEQLERRASRFADHSARHFGYDRSACPGAGAAGGLGYAFMQYMDADCQSGADLLLQMLHFDGLLDGCTRVFTGEGHADRQTLMGKLPERILRSALQHHVPVTLLAGHVDDADALRDAGFADVVCINGSGTVTADALQPEVARRRLEEAVERCLEKNKKRRIL